MTTNAANARIYGSDDDAVSIAALGSTLPTDLTTPLAATFADAGWLGPDGITLTPNDTVAQLRGHQGGKVVRTKVTESGKQFKFQCLESTALTLGLQHNITAKTTAAGVTTATISSSSRVEARAFVIDVYDVDNGTPVHDRYVIPRGEIGERAEVVLNNADITAYEFTVEVIDEYILISDNAALADDSSS